MIRAALRRLFDKKKAKVAAKAPAPAESAPWLPPIPAEMWQLDADADPWVSVKPRHVVKIIDVQDLWVRYHMNGTYPDERMPLGMFMACYSRVAAARRAEPEPQRECVSGGYLEPMGEPFMVGAEGTYGYTAPPEPIYSDGGGSYSGGGASGSWGDVSSSSVVDSGSADCSDSGSSSSDSGSSSSSDF